MNGIKTKTGILHEDGREVSLYQWLNGRLSILKEEEKEAANGSQQETAEDEPEFLSDYYL